MTQHEWEQLRAGPDVKVSDGFHSMEFCTRGNAKSVL